MENINENEMTVLDVFSAEVEEQNNQNDDVVSSNENFDKYGDKSESDNKELSNFIISLSGLPFDVTKDQILEFLEGAIIVGGLEGIHMAFARDGRFNGVAYVELASNDDVSHALTKHREHIGKRYIEIYQVTKRQMERGMNPRKQDMPVDAVVRLRGLPFKCSHDEIIELFDGLEIAEDGIVIILNEEGQVQGDGFVSFVDVESTEEAIKRHRQKIRHRYIEIYRSSLFDMQSTLDMIQMRERRDRRPGPYDRFNSNDHFSNFDMGRAGRVIETFMRRMGGGMGGGFGGGGGPMRGIFEGNDRFRGALRDRGHGWGNDRGFDRDNNRNFSRNEDRGYDRRRRSPKRRQENRDPRTTRSFADSKTGWSVHLRGLPYHVRDDEIQAFFNPIRVMGIYHEMQSDGRRSGNGNVDFANQFDADASLKKHREKIGTRYIEIYPNYT